MTLSPRFLTVRIAGFGAFVALALVGLIALLITAGDHTRQSFEWVSHTQQVIQTIDETVANLREAESGQRGFLITRNSDYADGFGARVLDAKRGDIVIETLVRDNPLQTDRAAGLHRAVEDKVASLQIPLSLGKRGEFDAARAIVSSGRGRELMNRVAAQAAAMKAEERRLLAVRIGEADRRSAWNRQLVLYGGPAIVCLLILFIALLVRSIRRPIESMLASMRAFGSGDRTARVTRAMGSAEFEDLASTYNVMADRLDDAMGQQAESDEQLNAANIALRQRGEELARRGEAIELLGGMAHRMQAARTDEELVAIVECFVPRVLPDVAGALYAHNGARNMLMRLATWGEAGPTPETFGPEQCWSLRRGQSHFLSAPGMDIVCAHVEGSTQAYHCEPLLAGGEVIGLLYLEGRIQAENRFRLGVLTENISSAMTNQRLQRGLREQSIRDPLTGLFNRRYMEESLATEVARAARGGVPLSLVMCDVDHFKRFNDEFGHDAGDALLRAVAAEMGRHFRDGDVICRFGGEEFTVISPGAEPAVLIKRVESVRLAIAKIALTHAGRPLGPVSMSFGIAGWNERMARDGSALVQEADAALYLAKRNGRNQSIIAEQRAA